MNKWFQFGIALSVGVIALGSAYNYGGIWDSQANPPIVTVAFKGGHEATGQISRTWSGEYLLRTEGGTETTFSDDALQSILFERPVPEATTLWRHWRSTAPPVLVSAMLLTWLMHWSGVVGFAYRRRNDKLLVK